MVLLFIACAKDLCYEGAEVLLTEILYPEPTVGVIYWGLASSIFCLQSQSSSARNHTFWRRKSKIFSDKNSGFLADNIMLGAVGPCPPIGNGSPLIKDKKQLLGNIPGVLCTYSLFAFTSMSVALFSCLLHFTDFVNNFFFISNQRQDLCFF